MNEVDCWTESFEVDSMSLYSKVLRRVFNDERFNALSKPQPNAQDLFMRLLCGPELTCVPGLIPIGEAAFAEALGWPIKAFRECWAEVECQGLAKADWKARLVWVPKAIKHNPPANPNVVVSWYQVIDLAPECALKTECLAALGAYVCAKGKTWPLAWDMALGKASRKPLPKTSANDFENDSDNGSATPSPNQESGSGSKKQEQDRSAGLPTPELPRKPTSAEIFDRASRGTPPSETHLTADDVAAEFNRIRLEQRRGKYAKPPQDLLTLDAIAGEANGEAEVKADRLAALRDAILAYLAEPCSDKTHPIAFLRGRVSAFVALWRSKPGTATAPAGSKLAAAQAARDAAEKELGEARRYRDSLAGKDGHSEAVRAFLEKQRILGDADDALEAAKRGVAA